MTLDKQAMLWMTFVIKRLRTAFNEVLNENCEF